MSDYEIFCTLVGAMKRIGQIEEVSLSKSGAISTDGVLPDGREVHFFVMAPKQEG